MPLHVILSIVLGVMTAFILFQALYALRRRHVYGAKPFALLCLASSLYSGGYALELLARSLPWADVMNRVQYLGLPFLPAFFVLLSLDIHRRKELRSRPFLMGLLGIPALTLVFRMLGDTVSLHYGQVSLVDNGLFQVLEFERGPWYYFHFLYLAACGCYSAWIHAQARRRAAGHYREQYLLLSIASVLPMMAVLVNLLGLLPYGLDSGPFIVFFNYLFFSWAIFRHDFLRLVPLARDKVFDWIADGVIVVDLNLKIQDYNRSAMRIFPELGVPKAGESGEAALMRIFAPAPDLHEALLAWKQSRHRPRPKAGAVAGEDCLFKERASLRLIPPFVLAGKDGAQRHYEVQLSDFYNKTRVVGGILLIGDVTAQTQTLRQLEYTSSMDGLTGLLNRAAFLSSVEKRWAGLSPEQPVSLLMLDLDHFKAVNDGYGHQAGDEVLHEISQVLMGTIRSGDLVGRFGGEEFVVFLPGTDSGLAALMAERLRAAVRNHPVMYDNQEIPVAVSIGVASLCQEGYAAELRDSLLRCADSALYLAKRNGRNRVEVYSGTPSTERMDES